MTDYFALYGLPLGFNPDMAVVKQQFYALSKKIHPDFYINDSQEKQAEVLEMSTLNNKAYQVLSDPQQRLHYILELRGILKEGENYALPQSFLMEMMDVNEALMDLQSEPDATRLAALKAEVASIEQGIADEIVQQTASFDTLNAAVQDEVLQVVKDLYYRNKYLIRIRESLDKLS